MTTAFYAAAQPQLHEIEDATIAVRQFGSGPHLVFIHGFPTHGYTWRKLLPDLSQHFTCHVVDLPGLGSSDWTANTDFTFTAQARRLGLLFDALNLDRSSLIAHNTGATIARLVALSRTGQVPFLVLINTEIPHQRPPWISTYQLLSRLPGANLLFRVTMRSKLWQYSALGFREFYSDKAMLRSEENLAPYLEPVLQSSRGMQGMLRYLQGIEWSVVDSMAEAHPAIDARTLLLWGENDKTFPIGQAQQMCNQFAPPAKLIALPASLLPHEEQPQQVTDHVLQFMSQA